jgi:copper chaperone CopZ
MKRFLFLFLIFIQGLTAVQAQFTKASLQATGLTCALCSNAINKAVLKLPFVASVRADIKNSSFSIVFKEGTELDIDAIKAAVEDAGFSVGGLSLTGHFNEVKLVKDQAISIGNEKFHFLNGDGKTLNGEQVIILVDKNFVSEKEFKKFSKETRLPCVQTGKATGACARDGMNPGNRIYHVMI